VFEGADVILSVGVLGRVLSAISGSGFGSPILNATNSTLVFSNITESQGDDYTVEITNPFGFADSDVATIVVSPTQPPTITQERHRSRGMPALRPRSRWRRPEAAFAISVVCPFQESTEDLWRHERFTSSLIISSLRTQAIIERLSRTRRLSDQHGRHDHGARAS